MDKVNKAFLQMIKFDRGDAGRIQHFTKVYGYAHLIGAEEGVDGADWQILLEADFLVNSYEKNMPADAIKNTIDQVFKTKAGTELCKLMYAL